MRLSEPSRGRPREWIDVDTYRGVVQHSERMARRDLVFDVVVVIAAIAIGILVTVGPSSTMEPHGGVMLAGMIAVSACLWWRRRAPLAVAWIVAVAGALMLAVELAAPGTLLRPDAPLESVVLIPPATPFAVYGAVAFAGHRRVTWLPVAVLLILATAPWEPSSQRIAPGLLLIGGPALLGLYSAARRRLLQALVDRAERAEREQHLLAEQARADERARLTAEMHDLVTHRVSVMVLQAGAMRLTAQDEATRDAAESLRVNGCQALDELRDLISVVRTDSGVAETVAHPPEPEPLPDLSPLISASESVGTPVTLAVAGTTAMLAPAVGRAAYRIVQEALTNVRKHAPGARTEIHLRYQSDGVHLAVHNAAATTLADEALVDRGTGSGLLGLRRRVELLGGTLNAGVAPDGGFHLEAQLPSQPSRKSAS